MNKKLSIVSGASYASQGIRGGGGRGRKEKMAIRTSMRMIRIERGSAGSSFSTVPLACGHVFVEDVFGTSIGLEVLKGNGYYQ